MTSPPWSAWKPLFTRPRRHRVRAVAVSMLGKIKRSKYPALTEAEEAISIPLQTLAQAIFDAILVHIVNEVSPGGRWQELQQQMCESLNRKKDEHTLAILADEYDDATVVFLQVSATVWLCDRLALRPSPTPNHLAPTLSLVYANVAPCASGERGRLRGKSRGPRRARRARHRRPLGHAGYQTRPELAAAAAKESSRGFHRRPHIEGSTRPHVATRCPPTAQPTAHSRRGWLGRSLSPILHTNIQPPRGLFCILAWRTLPRHVTYTQPTRCKTA